MGISPLQAKPIVSDVKFEQYAGDDAGQLTIDQVCCEKSPVNWEPSRAASTSFLKPVIWIKLPPLKGGTIIEFPQMVDKIELFERTGPVRAWTIQTTGDTFPLSRRPLKTAELGLRLRDSSGSGLERIVRLEQPSSVTHSIDNWSPSGFTDSSDQRFQVQLLLFGFCSAMVLFNFIVSIVSREKIFAFNAATISCTIMIAIYLTGQGGYLLWPESPEWSYISLVLAMGGLSLFATQFISTFLENGSVRQSLLTFNKWFGAAQFSTALVVLATNWHWLYAALLLVGLFSMGFQLFLVFSSIFRGDRQSLPILIPLSILIAGIVIRWGQTALAIDLGWANYHVMEIALALEAITFSLVLAARIRYLDKKANWAQTRLAAERTESANRFALLQDSERARFASDLHDSLGHTLAVAKTQLNKLADEEELPDSVADRIGHSGLAVREAISEARRISHDLHPAKLDHLGLQGSLQNMCDEFSDSCGIDSDVRLDFSENLLSYEDQMQIYRIVQEALSNIARHSDANRCWLSIIEESSQIEFELGDDGRGLSTTKDEKKNDGIGLFSLRQRTTLLGSDLQMLDGSQGGLILRFTLYRPQTEPAR